MTLQLRCHKKVIVVLGNANFLKSNLLTGYQIIIIFLGIDQIFTNRLIRHAHISMKSLGTFSKRMKLKRLDFLFFFYISANYQGCSVFTVIVAPKALWRPHRVCSYFDIGLRAHVTVNNSGDKKEPQDELPWRRNVAMTASVIFLKFYYHFHSMLLAWLS